MDHNELASGLRAVLLERKHHKRVRKGAIFLMGVVVAMLGIGAGLTYAVVLSLKDTEVREGTAADRLAKTSLLPRYRYAAARCCARTL